jgi:hypothetical protein
MHIAALAGRIHVSEYAPGVRSSWYVKLYSTKETFAQFRWNIFVSVNPDKMHPHSLLVLHKHVPQALQELVNGCVERGLGEPVVDWCEEHGDELWRLLFSDPTAFITTYLARHPARF